MLTMVTDVKMYGQAADALKVDSLQTIGDPTPDAQFPVRSAPWHAGPLGGAVWNAPEEQARPVNSRDSEGPLNSAAATASLPASRRSLAMPSSRAKPMGKPRAEMTLGELLYDVLIGEGSSKDEPA